MTNYKSSNFLHFLNCDNWQLLSFTLYTLAGIRWRRGAYCRQVSRGRRSFPTTTKVSQVEMVHIIHNIFMVLEVCHTEVIYSRMVERRGYHKNRESQQRVTLKQHSWNIHVSHFCAKKPQYQHCIIILQLVCSIRLARMWAFSKYAKVLCIWEHNTMDFILQMLLPVLDFVQHIHVHNKLK